MLHRIRTLQDVVDWGLCTGCGACHYHCRQGGVKLVNVEEVGIRPQFTSEACANCTACLSICPGYQLDANLATGCKDRVSEPDHEFGPALEIWEGHASDPEIRYQGSSGGVLSALSLFCVERGGMRSVLHTGADQNTPWMNRTTMSSTRAEILARSGSRYAPASPCDGLKGIEDSDGPCVFIGKPCDAAAVNMLRRQRPELDRNLGLVLTFFCAGTPSTQGTLQLLNHIKVAPENVRALRYRGEGWPGTFHVVQIDNASATPLLYADSWGRLTGYRPLRCNLCPDGLGRISDISCGDAWHKIDGHNDPGRSLVIVRTERGREVLSRAIEAGYVELTRVGGDAVMAAQTSLLQRRRELFGRLLAMRILMIPTPKFVNFSLMRSWFGLSARRRMQTLVGTLRRAVVRGWWRKRPVVFPKVRPSSSNA